MFLPKSKYKVKHASWGMFQLEGAAPGEYYVGPYIEDYLGRTYAGKDFETAQKRVLVPVSTKTETKTLVETNLVPDEEHYQSGSYVRYFRQNRYSKVVEEITEDRVKELGPWKIISGSWIISGKLDDTLYGPEQYRYLGVRKRNQETLDRWEQQIKGISEALHLKPEDFVREIN